MKECSQDLYTLTHGHFDVDTFHVMPSLLEQRGQEVEGHNDVGSDLFIGHLLVADSDVQVGDLLELPLNGTSDILDLLLERLGVGNWLWELTNSVKDWSKLGNFLDEGAGGEKHRVLLGPVLDELLIFVKLFEMVNTENIDVELVGLGFVHVLLISNHANLELWSWDVVESDLTNETLVFLWIVVLESNLKLDSLLELLFFGSFSHLCDALQNKRVCDL